MSMPRARPVSRSFTSRSSSRLSNSRPVSRQARTMTPLSFVEEKISEHDARIAQLEAIVNERDRRKSVVAQSETSTNTTKTGKVLSPDEEDRMLTRLTRPRKVHDEHLPPITGFKATQIDASTLEEMIDRLGESDVASRQQKMEDRLAAEEESHPLVVYAEEREMTTKLELEDQEAMAQRLCNNSMKSKQKKLQSLRDAADEEEHNMRKRFGTAVAAEVTARIYDRSVERKQEVMAKLHNQYVTATEIKKKKLSKSQQMAMADRLCTTK